MACGLPVVATDVGGIPEQVIDGETGFLVPAGEIVPMAARLFQILSDPMLSRHLGDRAAKVARNKFDFQTTVDRYISWYKEISSRASSNPTSFQE
jgi:glycosyltransferase involved in cell wall biosynthesis